MNEIAKYIEKRNAVVDAIGEPEFRRRETEKLKGHSAYPAGGFARLMNRIDREIVDEFFADPRDGSGLHHDPEKEAFDAANEPEGNERP